MAKRTRNAAVKLLVAGGVIVGVIFVADKTNLGTRIINGAKGLGETIGKTVTGLPAGIISGGAQGAGELGNTAATAGADFQEFVTGNRNAIGDFFAGLSNPFPQVFGDTGAEQQQQPAVNPTSPSATSALEKIDFGNILSSFNVRDNEIFTLNQPIAVGTRRNVNGITITGGRGVVTQPDAVGISGKILPVNAVGRSQPTLQGTRETVTRGTIPVSGSPALFARLRQNQQMSIGPNGVVLK